MKIVIAFTICVIAGLGVGCQEVKDIGNKATETAKNANSSGAVGKVQNEAGDDWISAKTKLSLIADKRTSGLETSVDTKDGVVTLSGKVDTDIAKKAATDIAGGIKGVKRVDNQLQVVPGSNRKTVDASDDKVNASIQDTLKNDSTLKDLGLTAKVNNGDVTLTGSVKNTRQLLAAAQAIQKVAGVKSVDTNQVSVKNQG